jgi:hypothetical protein
MKKVTEAAFKKRMLKVKVPEGFTATFGTDEFKQVIFTLEKPDDTKITFDQSGCGHTQFKAETGWRSFDRRGVEDSFYHAKMYDGDDQSYDADEIVTEQLKRITESREYHKTAVAVPGLPGGSWTVAPDAVEELKRRLKKSGHLSFTPSGFGTGYMVTKRPQRGLQYGETKATPELEAFLGHAPLYVHTLDCD